MFISFINEINFFNLNLKNRGCQCGKLGFNDKKVYKIKI